MKAKFLLERDGVTYRFVSVWQGNDFSLYVAFEIPPVPGRQTISIVRNAEDQANAIETARRLSYHTTGRVNYHGLIAVKPRYFEPLGDVTKQNLVFAIAVSDFGRLAPMTDVIDAASMASMRCGGSDGVCFGISVVPPDYQTPSGTGFFRVDFERFSAVLTAMRPPVHLGRSGVHAFAPEGALPGQVLSKEEAELAYVQGGVRELVVSGPNGQGTYTLYPSVVMRITPKVRMEFTRPDVRLELDQSSQPHKIRFRLYTPSGRVTLADLRGLISQIELDAEL